MKLKINGEIKEVHQSITVNKLLEDLQVKPEGKIIVINQEILQKDNWEEYQLCENDEIEIITMVGGG
ncbi:sulfur carrier protein ThiS [Natranaerobius trueperi]|uniref:Thiamine biosynthesis protein ThiS n=1 Tax=Natranaerobius trueperi TaxID=759412 RepID=A0A226BV23_9FIRM|nr:sulfur carrier protein ThiS [Natranaerobius trueperi]OWZ82825.1 thiamine biosynthesis protein ThiS [Natranaerobius trueperi]